MTEFATNDTWLRHVRLLVRGKGIDCTIDPLDGKISRMVIFVNLNGVKAIIQRFKGWRCDRTDLIEPFKV